MPEKSANDRAKEAAQRFSRKAVEFMERKAPVQEFVVKGGFTLCDFQCAVSEQAKKIPLLCEPKAGAGPYDWCYGPSCCNVIFPPDLKNGQWQVVICAKNGQLYAMDFSIKDRYVTLSGEPKVVEHVDEYEYVDEMEAEERAYGSMDSKTRKSPVGMFYRVADGEIEPDGEKFKVAFSSEFPVKRKAKEGEVKMGIASKVGDEYWELLSHRKGHYDFSGLNRGGAFLDQHISQAQLGKVHRALVSKDVRGRGVVEFDEASELSQIRKKQFKRKSRANISVGYTHTGFVGDETLADGRIAKRVKWAADEISSVDTGADPNAGEGRAREGVYFRSSDTDDDAEDTGMCLRCGEEFPLSKLDDVFMCEDCLGANRASHQIDSKTLTREKSMADTTVTITDAEVLTRAATHIDAAAKTREKDILTRNTEFGTMADTWVTKYGARQSNDGKYGADIIRGIATKFCQRDSTTPSATLKLEMGQELLAAVQDFKMEPYEFRKLATDKQYRQYSAFEGVRDILTHDPNDRLPSKGTFCRDVHDDMELRAKPFGGIGYKGGGFHVPFDAPTPYRPGARSGSLDRLERMYGQRSDRLARDLYTGDFTSGGALVPTIMYLPIIDLLYNRVCMAQAGMRRMGGLSGNVVMPRLTGSVTPSSVSEIQALTASQPTFDQISARPHRCGNTTVYGKQLLLQASPDVEMIIRDNAFRAMAIKLDELMLNGLGGNAEPLGVMNTPGIGVISFGSTGPSLYAIILMETTIRQQNVYDPISYMTTSSSRGLLRSTAAALIGASTLVGAGQLNAIWTGQGENEAMNGRPAYDTQQVPNNQMVAGAFEHYINFMWGGLDIVVDYVTLAAEAEIRLTYNAWIDGAATHPQAFCISSDPANV